MSKLLEFALYFKAEPTIVVYKELDLRSIYCKQGVIHFVLNDSNFVDAWYCFNGQEAFLLFSICC